MTDLQQPVTDAAMQVTDARVLATLTAERIDPDYVEFHDYDRTRPYSKLYMDRLSDRRVLVASGLPRVRVTDGSKLVPGWELSDEKYWLRNNLFDGYATPDGQYHIAVVNDQPDGPVAGDEAHWSPVLTIGKEIVTPRSLTILETDPTNPDYHDNVIEWDYGVCKRRIRVIEGRFRGSWIFDRDPGADVRIEYNREGRLHMRLGLARDRDGNTVEVEMPVKDVEYIPRARFLGAMAPVTVGDSATYRPDANTETSSVDGYAESSNGGDWAALVASAGSYANDSRTDSGAIYIVRNSGYWAALRRSILLFDTSGLADGATITAADLDVYATASLDPLSIAPKVGVYSSAPASNTAIVAGDFDSLGTTKLSDSTYGWLAWSGWKTYGLNATGLAAISKTGVTKLGLRESEYDATGTNPGSPADNADFLYHYYAEVGTSFSPKLTVTYTIGGTTIPVIMNSYRRLRG